MKVIFRNITSVLLAVIFLVTTSGFTVYEHQCYTDRTTEYAVLLPVFDCNHSEHEHHEELPPCCADPGSLSGEAWSADDCCDIDSHLVMLDITLDTQDLSKKLTSDPISFAGASEIIRIPVNSEITHIIVSNNLPPPLSGKALHIFLHHLNIPYPSV